MRGLLLCECQEEPKIRGRKLNDAKLLRFEEEKMGVYHNSHLCIHLWWCFCLVLCYAYVVTAAEQPARLVGTRSLRGCFPSD